MMFGGGDLLNAKKRWMLINFLFFFFWLNFNFSYIYFMIKKNYNFFCVFFLLDMVGNKKNQISIFYWARYRLI
jgi:hypothetical protein